jgi:tetratricopeptide (TPR) repeat protein
LVDIGLRRQDTKEVDTVLAKMNAATSVSSEPSVQYARGKALLSKRDFSGARSALGAVPSTHALYLQAKYMLGVVSMREVEAQNPPPKLAPGEQLPPAPKARYASTIELFKQVTQLPATTDDQRRVVDLAWLAVGRLFYEADQWMEAADGYTHIDRQSSEFGNALFELAWVYVRMGDSEKALRALEVMAIADPNNDHITEGPLLRADLQLRAGKFEKAQKSYELVRDEFDPMRARVDRFLKSSTSPSEYYDKLVKDQLESSESALSLPPIAIQWAREDGLGPAAFAVVDEVVASRELLKDAQTIVTKLRVILNSPNRVRAFPELKNGDERTTQLLNRVSMARATIGQGLDDAGGEAGGDLQRIRAERRDLQRRVLALPVTDGDMAAREASAQRQWNAVSQTLHTLGLEVDQLQAIINGLNRMLSEGRSVGRDQAQQQQWQAEIASVERELKFYKDQITEIRRLIEAGRLQVGFGDQRFIDDAELRKAYRDKLSEELRMVASQGGKAAAYAGRVGGVMSEADASEARLEEIHRVISEQVAKRTTEVVAIVEGEAAKLATYAQRLDQLDEEARLTVGGVAMQNFALVHEKLRQVVVHADVGLTEQAWEVREEQVYRVRTLQVERIREEQILNEELREVLDDASDSSGAPPAH